MENEQVKIQIINYCRNNPNTIFDVELMFGNVFQFQSFFQVWSPFKWSEPFCELLPFLSLSNVEKDVNKADSFQKQFVYPA